MGLVSRRLDVEHAGEPRAVGGLRPRQSRPAQQPGARTLRPGQGLQPVPEPCRQASGQSESDEADVHRGSEEVSGLPDGRLGGSAHRGAASEHHRRSHRVRLHAPDDRSAAGRFADVARHARTRSRRTSMCRRWRRGHDPDLRWTVWRLRILSAQGQAGVPLEPD